MPIEIRELVIRAVVRDKPEAKVGEGDAARDRRIVDECVREVMKILRRGKQR